MDGIIPYSLLKKLQISGGSNYVTNANFDNTKLRLTLLDGSIVEALFSDILKHNNKDVLDKISEDINGQLLYDGQPIASSNLVDIIDDTVISLDKTYSSNKINGLIDELNNKLEDLNNKIDSSSETILKGYIYVEEGDDGLTFVINELDGVNPDDVSIYAMGAKLIGTQYTINTALKTVELKKPLELNQYIGYEIRKSSNTNIFKGVKVVGVDSSDGVTFTIDDLIGATLGNITIWAMGVKLIDTQYTVNKNILTLTDPLELNQYIEYEIRKNEGI